LFFFALNRGWKTLLVAALIHGAAHLFLCQLMGAQPLGVFADVWQDNSRVFNRNTMLTIWLPFRTLARRFPQAPIPANLMGALALMVMIGGLILLWRRRPTRPDYVAWIFMLGLLSTLAVTPNSYHFAYFLAGWLWCFSVTKAPQTRLPQMLVLACLAYLTIIHRLLGALCGQQGWENELWFRRAFNSGLFLLCTASLVLFLRTMRNATPRDPGDATSDCVRPIPVPP
jgi:hypothetical protein